MTQDFRLGLTKELRSKFFFKIGEKDVNNEYF